MVNRGEQNHGEQVRDVHFSEDHLIVDLVDGRTVSAPLTTFPRLLHASPAQRINWTAAGGGFGIHWPDVDEDVSISILLHGTDTPQGDQPAPRG